MPEWWFVQLEIQPLSFRFNEAGMGRFHRYAIYMAFTLITWIQAEMIFLQTIHWLHMVYMVWAMAIIYVALLPQIRNLYKIKS